MSYWSRMPCKTFGLENGAQEGLSMLEHVSRCRWMMLIRTVLPVF
jgi:hypothetical protein